MKTKNMKFVNFDKNKKVSFNKVNSIFTLRLVIIN